jgi:hypothetical protein
MLDGRQYSGLRSGLLARSRHITLRVQRNPLETVAVLVEGVACSGFLERTPSRTTVAHDGAAQENEGSAGSERWWCYCSRDSDP